MGAGHQFFIATMEFSDLFAVCVYASSRKALDLRKINNFGRIKFFVILVSGSWSFVLRGSLQVYISFTK